MRKQPRTKAAIAARRTNPRAALYRNGYLTLWLAAALALFAAAALLGAGGQWNQVTLWLAAAVTFFGGTSLLCFTLGAHRRGRTPGDQAAEVTHPGVSHPPAHPAPIHS